MENTLLSGASATLSGIVLAGAFSLVTEGQHTPAIYAYQIDRIPEALAIIPLADAFLGTSLLFPKTRIFAALVYMLDQGGGIVRRLLEGKTVGSDLGLFLLAAGVAALQWFVGKHRNEVN